MLALSLASCNNPVFDDEGDCEVHYFLNFVYDKNLKWADAFPSEVKSVNLYVFDNNGIFVKEYTDNTSALSQPGYMMELDLPAGDYQLLAWCGISNEGVSLVDQSFTVPVPIPGSTSIDQMTCSLNTTIGEDSQLISDTMLKFMYHGYMTVNLPDSKDGASYYHTMYLTKDTNHIRIMLQQLSGDDMNPQDFALKIEDSNGVLGYDNNLIGDAMINYTPWDQFPASAEVDVPLVGGGSELVMTAGVIADLSTSRLMADHSNELYLTVTNLETEEDIITRVPLIQYALLAKDYYVMAYGHNMTDQDFLDREDEYIMTFFLDKNLRWVDAYILVQSWRVVLADYNL